MVEELENQLSIKLKNVPKEEDQEEEEEEGYEVFDGESEKKIITRICHVCNKGFSSGKALGGHMRIHGQQYKKRKEDAAFQVKEDEEEEDEYEYCYDDNEEDERVVIRRGGIVERMKKKRRKRFMKKMKMVVPVCLICGKDFQSMKSLYGHMRSHPRNWKGIHPPAETAENPVVSGGAATVVDLNKALKCWSVTAKRGRKVMSGGDQTSSLSEDTEEEQLRDAAHELMMLAHGASHHDQELDSKSLSYKVVDDEHGDRNNWVNLDFTVRKPAPFSVGKQQLRIDGGNTKNLRPNTSRVMTKNNVRGKAKAMPENQEAAAFGGFTENSSLGGEESKKKSIIISGHRETTYNNIANENTRKKRKKLIKLKDLGSVHHNAAAAVDHDNRTLAAEKYKCSECDKWFRSHQALGGHKSSHNKLCKMVIQNSIDDDDQVPLMPSIQVTNSPGELSHTTAGGGGGSSQHRHHQILDFDLNEVPQTTEEENEAAAADQIMGMLQFLD
ncbi:PREDICTED: uncharacterized protein LOC109178118 isoform X3 [Ipomoea nil]|uniref:uncharacterized protein LOC109178118 isoform X3 n=1 Tax=Ipomoea nil TaxID=35883 RepID=UPI0009010741|nr:PREDICTED: uncharacterized protein LOC109178118 isoform X3 [Ipomoea nil]